MARRSGLDSKVVELAQAGDEQARERLLESLSTLLRTFFTSRIGDRTDVDDLVQNTLLRVHNSLSHLNDPSRLKGFTMKAALFELQDYYRGRYRAKERLADQEGLAARAGAEHVPLDGIDLERALETLSPRARRIVELREYGYRYEEIAEVIGTTEAAIKMQVKRAFEKMRSVLIGLVALFLSALT